MKGCGGLGQDLGFRSVYFACCQTWWYAAAAALDGRDRDRDRDTDPCRRHPTTTNITQVSHNPPRRSATPEQCMMNPRVQSRKVRVESWLASLSPEAEIAIEEPLAKRIRRDADGLDVTFLHTYNISPPPTMDQEHHED